MKPRSKRKGDYNVRVDYYEKFEHMNAKRSGHPASQEGAFKGAVVHLVLGHYEKAVAVRRSNEHVLWTRIRIPGIAGGQIIVLPGGNTPGELNDVERRILGYMNRR